ncbi:MAG: hypothetical protein APF84_09385 [Gracilibacter sp. BRH_c7a]|nr:MAG: hypothetical protein APF84_09385 [Gracilibacter sp. BRH_c7a]
MRINSKKKLALIQNGWGMLPFLLILALFILHLALPDKTFSQEERRYLAQWPVFDIETVLNGSYESKVEAYFSDQFPFRDVWVHIQEGSNQILFDR